jgi:hypothetical protein
MKRFSASELRILESVAKERQPGTRIFVVVKFCLANPKVVVAGIEVILRKKAISASKGGIDWPPWTQSAD